MTKKILAMFLAVLMVVSVLPLDAFAAGHNHCPGAGVKHTTETCDSYTEGEYVAPTCGTDGGIRCTCNECGSTFLKNVEAANGRHDWQEYPEQKPTCGSEGHTAGQKCANCGQVKGVTFYAPVLTEGRDCEYEIISNPETDNCVLGGTIVEQCKHCGQQKIETKVENQEHNWGEYEQVKAATKTENGLAKRTCMDCGLTEEVAIFHTHDEVLIKVDEVEAACEKTGTKEHYKCIVCGQKYWDAAGTRKVQKDVDLVISALRHVTRDVRPGECDVNELGCVLCGKMIAVKHADHVFNGQFNCTNKALQCVNCEKWFHYGEDGIIDHDENVNSAYYNIYVGHQFDELFDCRKLEQECTVCHESFTYDEVKNTLHTNARELKHVVTTGSVFNCLTSTHLCMTCDKMVKYSDGIEVSCNVTFETHVFAGDFDYICQEQTCSRCLNKYTYATAIIDDLWAQSVAPVDHDWNTPIDCQNYMTFCKECHLQNTEAAACTPGAEQYKAPTCVENGYKSVNCTVCNKQLKYEHIAPLGHLEYTVTVPATCTTKGYTYTICLRDGCVSVKTVTKWADESNKKMEYAVVGDYLKFTKDGKTYYFDGTLNTAGEMNYTTNIKKAVVVWYEKTDVNGEYNLYFWNPTDGHKTYINIEVILGIVSVKLGETASSIKWTWSADGLWTVNVLGYDYFLGSYYNSVRKTNILYIYKTSYLSNSQYTATKFDCFVDYAGVVGVKLINIEIGSQLNSELNGHQWVNNGSYDITCEDGAYIAYQCAECKKWSKVYVREPGVHYELSIHKYGRGHNMTTTTDLDEIREIYPEEIFTSVSSTCQNTGYHYEICTRCNVVVRETDSVVSCQPLTTAPTTDHLHQSCSWTWRCKWCSNVTTQIVQWDGVSYIDHPLDNRADANLKHEHGLDEAEWLTVKDGDCSSYGVERAYCTICREYVYVAIKGDTLGDYKTHIWTEAKNGELVNSAVTPSNAHENASCTENGYDYYVGCYRCRKAWEVENGKLSTEVAYEKAGTFELIEKLPHNMVETSYKPNCYKPDYTNKVISECYGCGYQQRDTTELIGKITRSDISGKFCSAYTYELYKCNCGELHFINYVGGFGAQFVERSHTDATCENSGAINYYCYFCDESKTVITASKAHVNDRGVWFYECYQDKNVNVLDQYGNVISRADRFCVLCNEEIGVPAKKGECGFYNADYRVATCTEAGYTVKYCACCGETVVIDQNAPALGHDVPVRTEKKYNDRVYVKDGSNYYEYIEYVAPTSEQEGYYKAWCARCNKVVEGNLPKLAGLNMTIGNENNAAGNEFTFGSVITVIVSADNVDTAAAGIEFNLNYNREYLKFIGAENLTGTAFAMGELDPKTQQTGTLNVTFVSGTDVELKGNVQLVKLSFRVYKDGYNVNADGEEIFFNLSDLKAIDDLHTDVTLCKLGEDAKAILMPYMMTTNATGIDLVDVQKAMTLIGKGYNVALDADADGKITFEDLRLMMRVKNKSDKIDTQLHDRLLAEGKYEEISIIWPNLVFCDRCGHEYNKTENTVCPECHPLAGLN